MAVYGHPQSQDTPHSDEPHFPVDLRPPCAAVVRLIITGMGYSFYRLKALYCPPARIRHTEAQYYRIDTIPQASGFLKHERNERATSGRIDPASVKGTICRSTC